MDAERRIINILLLQLTQSKAIVLFLITLIISYFGRMLTSWSWIFEYMCFSSVYFIIYLFAFSLTTSLHERRHFVKLKELGYEITNLKVHRVGSISFWIANIEQMTPDESYQIAAAPFVAPISYIAEITMFLIIVDFNLLSPFPLTLPLLFFTFLLFVSLIGNCCAAFTVRMRKASGLCVKLARTITSKGDIDEIVAWNKLDIK